MSSKRLWMIQLLGLVGTATWAASDPLFDSMSRSRSWEDLSVHVGWLRITGFAGMAVAIIFSLAALLVNTLGGRQAETRSRSIAQLLAITAMIAVWCSLPLHVEALTWQGKRARFALRVGELERLAAPLRSDWPEQDGELQSIGPFMAYPFGRPTTLVLLQAPRIADQSVYVSAIERGSSGAIRLQLTGTDGGDWAEWHPPHSGPSSFVGGLADPHELSTAAAIGDGWYLVRYNA